LEKLGGRYFTYSVLEGMLELKFIPICEGVNLFVLLTYFRKNHCNLINLLIIEMPLIEMV